jgi:hypothetical protein
MLGDETPSEARLTLPVNVAPERFALPAAEAIVK